MALNRPYRIDRVVYPRPSLPDNGWIEFVNQAPPAFDAALFPAIEQLLRAFRVFERELKPRLDQPQLGRVPEAPTTEPKVASGISGRDFTLDIHYQRTDFPQFGWIFQQVPVPFDETLFPAIDQLAKSFRTDRRAPEFQGVHRVDLVPPAAAPFDLFLPAIDQLIRSFRVPGPIPDVFKFVIRVDEFNPPVPPEPPPSVCPPLTTAADGNASPDPPDRVFIRLWPTQQPEVFETLPLDVGGADNGMTTIGVTFDGAGSVLTVGKTADIWIPFGATITGNTMLAAEVGSVQIGVWKDTYANYPPTGADSITGGAAPTITAANKSQDLTLTGWTTTITAGDTIRFNVNSVTTITQVTLTLRVQKT